MNEFLIGKSDGLNVHCTMYDMTRIDELLEDFRRLSMDCKRAEDDAREASTK